MGTIKIAGKTIPRVEQNITINGSRDRRIWCDSVNISAGLGGTTAAFSIPDMLSDDDRRKYKDAKVVVSVGLEGSGKEVIFAGIITTDLSSLGPDNDSCSLQAVSVGAFLNKVGVGEDLNQWEYIYELLDDKDKVQYTPVSVLVDLFERLSDDWKESIALGDLRALLVIDLPTTSYKFNLLDYKSAIEMVMKSLGDVAVKERFTSTGKTYLDFYRVSDNRSPVNRVKIANWNGGRGENVFTIESSSDGSEIINQAIAFGRNKCFVATCQSKVAGIAWSEQDSLKSLQKMWDPTLEAIAIQDKKICQADITSYGLKVLEAAGSGALTIKVESGLDLSVALNKVFLTHKRTGERMKVTGFTNRILAEPDAVPPTEGTPATVTVIRQWEQSSAEVSEIKLNDILQVEIPGISSVYRDYKLPKCFETFPAKIILNDIPILDPLTEERIDMQIYTFKGSLYPNEVPIPDPENPVDPEDPVDPEADPINTLTGVVTQKPNIIEGVRLDMAKNTFTLREAALVEVKIQKLTVSDGVKPAGAIKKTYAETPVGVTFAYIDNTYTYGYKTGVAATDTEIPWEVHTERVAYPEAEYNQVSNMPTDYFPDGFPVINKDGLKIFFVGRIYNPKTGQLEYPATEATVLRNNLTYVKNAAFRLLSGKLKRQVSYSVRVDWFDSAFALGNRLQVQGKDDYVKDVYSINQITYDMPLESGVGHSTSITADNRPAPIRQTLTLRGKKKRDKTGPNAKETRF